jgi:lipid-A-disaccharide synthase
MRVYIVAGEASGDFLGANLIKALKEKDPSLCFSGVGGDLMAGQGVSSLFPMQHISLMGIAEIIPHVPRLLKRINQTVQHVIETHPSVIVTIDSPGFCLRVVKKLRHLGIRTPVIHYVAPSVWAWRPKRAKRLADLVDHLLTLFPFEPPYFTKHGLDTTFVGHPLLETPMPKVLKDKNAILLLPGSRLGEVTRHWPVFIEAAQMLLQRFPNIQFYTPTFEHLLPFLTTYTPDGLPVHFSLTQDAKNQAFQKASMALAASGTVSLELARALVPMVVAYKVSPLTYFALKHLVHTPYACLVNILLQKPLVPELLQHTCTPTHLYEAMVSVMDDGAKQTDGLSQAVELLSPPQEKPSMVAARLVWQFLTHHA